MNNDSEKQEEGSSCGCGGGSCCSGPGKWIWIVLAVAVVGVLIAKNTGKKPTAAAPAASEPPAAVEASAVSKPASEPATQSTPLPRLVDLGADKCQACKMMTPVLDGLRKDYAGVFVTEFIDVWEQPDEAKRHAVKLIPTQIFYDAEGNELFRHEGFFGKDDILAKWRELGVSVAAPGDE